MQDAVSGLPRIHLLGTSRICRGMGPTRRPPQPGGVPSTGVLSLTDQPSENWAEHTTA